MIDEAKVIKHFLSDGSPVFDVQYRRGEGYRPITFGAVDETRAHVLADALNRCVSWVQVGE